MAIPPNGDPRRPLHLAVSSMRLLGVIFLFVGLLFVVSYIGAVSSSGAAWSRIAQILSAACGAFGALYLVFSYFLKRYQTWAVTASLVLAGLQELLGVLWTIYRPNVISVIWLAAIGQMIWHLSLSYGAIRAEGAVAPRGFEPLPPADAPARPGAMEYPRDADENPQNQG